MFVFSFELVTYLVVGISFAFIAMMIVGKCSDDETAYYDFGESLFWLIISFIVSQIALWYFNPISIILSHLYWK